MGIDENRWDINGRMNKMGDSKKKLPEKGGKYQGKLNLSIELITE